MTRTAVPKAASSSRRMWSAALLFLVAGVAGAATPESREDALRAMHSTDAESRREAVAWLGRYGAMQDLEPLAEALRDEHPEVRDHAEGALVQVWSRSGDQQVDGLLRNGIQQMEGGLMGQAVDTFTRIIELRPDFAEGWNKRATAYFLMGQFEQSLRDCDEVMSRNPLHFGALSGYGMIYLKLGDLERAMEYFEQALAVNPNLTGAQVSVDLIRRRLGRQGKQSI